MVYAKITATFRLNVDECRNVLLQMVNKYKYCIDSCIRGMGDYLDKPLIYSKRMEAYDKKLMAFVEYFKTQANDIAEHLFTILKREKSVKLYVYKMSIWVTYKSEGVMKQETLLGMNIETTDATLYTDTVPESSLHADISAPISFENAIASLFTIAATYYDRSETYLKTFKEHTDIFTEDEFKEMNDRNNEFITRIANNINSYASTLKEFIDKHKDISIDISNFKIKIQSYEDDDNEEVQKETIELN